MKKFLFLFLLLPFSSFAQKLELGLGSGFAFGDEQYHFHSFQAMADGKRWQIGAGLDMADPGYQSIVTPHILGNAKFPVKYGYFYAGIHGGYAMHWEGIAWGGQAGATANLGKCFALNAQLTLRMMSSDNIYNADPLEPIAGDAEPFIGFTFGIRYRFH